MTFATRQIFAKRWILSTGTGIHPNKPLDGFSLTGVTGSCARGISLANVKNAELRNIHVTGYSGPLLGIYNVTGKGLDGSATIDPPKLPEPVAVAGEPYRLH